MEKFRQIVPWLALFASVGVIVLQRCTIGSLEHQLETTGLRTKRSVEDNAVYVPVFAQVSKKAWKRMCKHHYNKAQRTERVQTTTVAPTAAPVDKIERKRCSGDVSFLPPQLVAVRPNRVGTAMRDGAAWYTTEYDLGYSILQFSNTKALNESDPRSIRTLPYPFHGTDHVVHGGTVFFNHANSLFGYNLRTGATAQLSLELDQQPLYNSSKSFVDVQADEHGMWIIYRQPGQEYPTISRLFPKTLKVLSTWYLRDTRFSSWCNSFIRCGILYSVTCLPGEVSVQPVYDFYQNMHINGKETTWKGLSSVTSAQYDPRSRSIAIFSVGNIYSIDTY